MTEYTRKNYMRYCEMMSAEYPEFLASTYEQWVVFNEVMDKVSDDAD